LERPTGAISPWTKLDLAFYIDDKIEPSVGKIVRMKLRGRWVWLIEDLKQVRIRVIKWIGFKLNHRVFKCEFKYESILL
jgi:hypothetical protein